MTPADAPNLRADETEIVNLEEELRRQIHPSQVRDNTITTGVFSTRDQMVSTFREAVPPEEAHRIHTEEFGLQTVGSCVVSVGDVKRAGLRAVDDSAVQGVHPSHSYIDMRGLGKSARDKAAKELKRAALQNQIWYPP